MSLAVSVFAQAKPSAQIAPIEKKHVVWQGRLNDTARTCRIIVWQSANPAGGKLPYAKAHLAIEPAGGDRRAVFETDGGETQYLIDQIEVVDLDGDRLPEILSLWWEGASAGAVLRVFHYDRGRRAFVEVRPGKDLSGVHHYELLDAADARGKRHIAAYTRPDAGQSPEVTEYEVRNSRIVPVKTAGGRQAVNHNELKESGIEGQSVIGPTRPHIRVGDSTPDVVPFQSILMILAAKDGREVKRLETGSDGRFRVTLPPGEYLIRPIAGQRARLPRAEEQTVTVLAGQFMKITITFDSGMR